MLLKKEFLGQMLVISDDISLLKEYFNKSIPVVAVLNQDNQDIDSSFAKYAVTSEAINDDSMDEYYERVVRRYLGRPVITARSERIVLRELKVSDLNQLMKIYDDSNGMLEPFYGDLEDAGKWLERYIPDYYDFHDSGMYGIVLTSDGDIEPEDKSIIGIAGLGFEGGEPELGYALLQEYRGRGYGYEAAEMVLECYFVNMEMDAVALDGSLNVPEVLVKISKGNDRSMHLAKRLSEKYRIRFVTI